MVALLYIIPVAACLVLHFGFRYEGDWTAYAWIFGCGEATIVLLQIAFFRSIAYFDEYLGSTVRSIHYEAPWTEVITVYETRTDSKGRTYTRARRQYIYHPEKHYFHTTTGARHATNSAFFNEVRDRWNVAKHPDRWTGLNIVGGVRSGFHYNFSDLPYASQCDIAYWIPITELHKYKNKVRCSNSIFKFEKISREEAEEKGLIDYPKISGYDAPAILSKDFTVPEKADDMFRKFNAGIAPGSQMRLYILLFDGNKEIGVSELQRAYWQGGNKNEFVICIGIDGKGSVKWARAFSWADEQQIEVEVAQEIMKWETLDWQRLFRWLQGNISRWKRKEFKDFNYINVSLPLKHFIWILILSLIENSLAVWFFLTR